MYLLCLPPPGARLRHPSPSSRIQSTNKAKIFTLQSTSVAVESKACTMESSSRATNWLVASLRAWIGVEPGRHGECRRPLQAAAQASSPSAARPSAVVLVRWSSAGREGERRQLWGCAAGCGGELGRLRWCAAGRGLRRRWGRPGTAGAARGSVPLGLRGARSAGGGRWRATTPDP